MENLDGYEEPHNLLTNPGLFPKIHASQYPFLPYTNEESSRKPTKWQSEISKPVLLSAFASEEHVRSMACAAWAIVLALYTGREDACFGILIHDGNGWSPETALPIHCERTMPVSRLVARAEDFLNGLYRNVAANCHKIAELRNYLAFVPHSMAGVSSDGLYYSPPHNSALVLSLSLKDQHLSLRSDFDPWVVSPDEIRRAMGHFTQVSGITNLDLHPFFANRTPGTPACHFSQAPEFAYLGFGFAYAGGQCTAREMEYRSHRACQQLSSPSH